MTALPSTGAFTVALVGADGAGKTTVARRLERDCPVPLKYLYMGINPAASNCMLPTTRLWWAIKRASGRGADQGGPPDPARTDARPQSWRLRAAWGIKGSLRLLHRLAEEWYRQGVAWYYQCRGYVVVFDRHFFSDYYAHEISAGDRRVPVSRRLHGFVLARLYPRPRLVILLDAPADVLFRRKGEGTVGLLEARRQEYFRLRPVVEHFEVIDASRSLDEVLRDVSALIVGFGEQRHA